MNGPVGRWQWSVPPRRRLLRSSGHASFAYESSARSSWAVRPAPGGGTTTWAKQSLMGPQRDWSHLNNPQLRPDLLECSNGLVQVVARVCRRDLTAHACLALGHYWITKAGHEHPVVEQHVAH